MLDSGEGVEMLDPKAVVRRLREALSRRDRAAVESLTADDCVYPEAPAGPARPSRSREIR